jgi:hypothetical protein
MCRYAPYSDGSVTYMDGFQFAYGSAMVSSIHNMFPEPAVAGRTPCSSGTWPGRHSKCHGYSSMSTIMGPVLTLKDLRYALYHSWAWARLPSLTHTCIRSLVLALHMWFCYKCSKRSCLFKCLCLSRLLGQGGDKTLPDPYAVSHCPYAWILIEYTL